MSWTEPQTFTTTSTHTQLSFSKMFKEAFQCFQLLSHDTLHLTSLKADELTNTSLCEVIFHTQTQPHVFHGIPHPPFLYLHCMQPHIIWVKKTHNTAPWLKLLAGSEFSKCTITPPLFDWSPVWLQDILCSFLTLQSTHRRSRATPRSTPHLVWLFWGETVTVAGSCPSVYDIYGVWYMWDCVYTWWSTAQQHQCCQIKTTSEFHVCIFC